MSVGRRLSRKSASPTARVQKVHVVSHRQRALSRQVPPIRAHRHGPLRRATRETAGGSATSSRTRARKTGTGAEDVAVRAVPAPRPACRPFRTSEALVERKLPRYRGVTTPAGLPQLIRVGEPAVYFLGQRARITCPEQVVRPEGELGRRAAAAVGDDGRKAAGKGLDA